ncbi:unnamed protein product [Vicia faba]|uniref:Non-specific serine/threonine protein kinase n=1 Tax=Vicia faba TaxID=3906 RepID=A0AAV0YLN2_VICFA|nr:unnamed protein product [Vicia faba]
MFLCNNMLQGNIPEPLFNLVNLTNLCLSSNNLSGLVNFKLISKFQNLESLSLSRNSQLSLNFESDSETANYSFPSLRVLPKSFGEVFPSLVYVDLSNNKLSGRVPNWLPEMSLLQSLNLSQNMFTSIDQFSMHYWLRSLDLSFNSLGGEMSLSICNTAVLQILNLSRNKFTVLSILMATNYKVLCRNLCPTARTWKF